MNDSNKFHIMNLALAVVIAAVLVADRRSAVQLMALTGSTWLGMLLIIPRLLYSSHFGRWEPELLRIAKLSKYVGLWAAAWFTAHAVTAVVTYYGVPTDLTAFVRDFETSQPIILAAASLTILLLLALISNKWSYKHLPWWKHLNMLVWAIPLMALAHSVLAATTFRNELPLLLIAPALFTVSALSGYSVLFAKQKKRMDYLRLLFLSLGGLAALVVVFAWPR